MDFPTRRFVPSSQTTDLSLGARWTILSGAWHGKLFWTTFQITRNSDFSLYSLNQVGIWKENVMAHYFLLQFL